MSQIPPNCDQSQLDAYFQQELAAAHPMLESRDGGFAYVAEFDPELFFLTIRVEHESQPNPLLIICETPSHFSGPLEWQNCKLRLTRDGEFFLTDIGAGVVVRSCVIDVRETPATQS